MNKVVLNYIQEELGTEPKPVWTEVDEKAFESYLSDIDLRQFPDLSYSQFKDLAFDQLYTTAEADVIESAFDLVDGLVQTFEQGGILIFQEGGTTNVKKNISGEAMLNLIRKNASTGNARKDAKGMRAIEQMIQSNPNISFNISPDGGIEVVGMQDWQAGSGTGANFANKPSLLQRITRGGENKAQRLFESLAGSISSGKQSDLFKDEPKKEESKTEDKKVDVSNIDSDIAVTNAAVDAAMKANEAEDARAAELSAVSGTKKTTGGGSGGSGKGTSKKGTLEHEVAVKAINERFANLTPEAKSQFQAYARKRKAELKGDPSWYVTAGKEYFANMDKLNAQAKDLLSAKAQPQPEQKLPSPFDKERVVGGDNKVTVKKDSNTGGGVFMSPTGFNRGEFTGENNNSQVSPSNDTSDVLAAGSAVLSTLVAGGLAAYQYKDIIMSTVKDLAKKGLSGKDLIAAAVAKMTSMFKRTPKTNTSSDRKLLGTSGEPVPQSKSKDNVMVTPEPERKQLLALPEARARKKEQDNVSRSEEVIDLPQTQPREKQERLALPQGNPQTKVEPKIKGTKAKDKPSVEDVASFNDFVNAQGFKPIGRENYTFKNAKGQVVTKETLQKMWMKAKSKTPKGKFGMLIPRPKATVLQLGGLLSTTKKVAPGTAKEAMRKRDIAKGALSEYGSDAAIGVVQGLMGGARKAENNAINNTLEVASMLPVIGVPAQIANSLYRMKQEYDAGDLDYKDVVGEAGDVALSFVPGGKAAKGGKKLVTKALSFLK